MGAAGGAAEVEDGTSAGSSRSAPPARQRLDETDVFLDTASQHERKTRVQLPYLGGPHVLTMQDLSELVVELASRPGHEKVRVLLHRLLVGGLGANSQDIDFERPVPEVRGRIDALLGRTVFELKSDLRRERKDAEKGLTRYLSEREGQTGEKYVGIATDGADFIAFFLKNGSVVEVGTHRTDLEKVLGIGSLVARSCRRRR